MKTVTGREETISTNQLDFAVPVRMDLKYTGDDGKEHRPYILLGPGRWGTSDRFLGVPVSWGQVSAARVIIETAIPGFNVDPSQGTHFFHNITSLRVGYLSVDPQQESEKVDWDWVESQPHVLDLKFVKQVRTTQPIVVRLDGVSGRGYITTGHREEE